MFFRRVTRRLTKSEGHEVKVFKMLVVSRIGRRWFDIVTYIFIRIALIDSCLGFLRKQKHITYRAYFVFRVHSHALYKIMRPCRRSDAGGSHHFERDRASSRTVTTRNVAPHRRRAISI